MYIKVAAVALLARISIVIGTATGMSNIKNIHFFDSSYSSSASSSIDTLDAYQLDKIYDDYNPKHNNNAYSLDKKKIDTIIAEILEKNKEYPPENVVVLCNNEIVPFISAFKKNISKQEISINLNIKNIIEAYLYLYSTESNIYDDYQIEIKTDLGTFLESKEIDTQEIYFCIIPYTDVRIQRMKIYPLSNIVNIFIERKEIAKLLKDYIENKDYKKIVDSNWKKTISITLRKEYFFRDRKAEAQNRTTNNMETDKIYLKYIPTFITEDFKNLSVDSSIKKNIEDNNSNYIINIDSMENTQSQLMNFYEKAYGLLKHKVLMKIAAESLLESLSMNKSFNAKELKSVFIPIKNMYQQMKEINEKEKTDGKNEGRNGKEAASIHRHLLLDSKIFDKSIDMAYNIESLQEHTFSSDKHVAGILYAQRSSQIFLNYRALETLNTIMEFIVSNLLCMMELSSKQHIDVEKGQVIVDEIKAIIIPGIEYAIANEEDPDILIKSIYYYIFNVLSARIDNAKLFENVLYKFLDINEYKNLSLSTFDDLEEEIRISEKVCKNFRNAILGTLDLNSLDQENNANEKRRRMTNLQQFRKIKKFVLANSKGMSGTFKKSMCVLSIGTACVSLVGSIAYIIMI